MFSAAFAPLGATICPDDPNTQSLLVVAKPSKTSWIHEGSYLAGGTCDAPSAVTGGTTCLRTKIKETF